MQRVSLVEKDQADPVMRKEVYQEREDQGGRVINLFKVMGHCPSIGLNFIRLARSILQGEELPANLREMIILRVTNLAQAEYAFIKHTAAALRNGVSQKQIDAISAWEASAEFNEPERAMLAYTDEVAQYIKVKDETFARLQSFFNEHAIVELTTVIGFYGMVSRTLVALQIELEPEV